MLHPGNVRGLQKPKNWNVKQLCLRFHNLGYCFDDCGYKQGHGQLDDSETNALKSFVEAAKAAKATLVRRRQGNSRDNNGN